MSEDTIIKYRDGRKSNGKQFDRYIEDACPRISIEGDKNINHFDLIRYLKRVNDSKYENVMEELCTASQEQLVLDMLKQEFIPLFSKVRGDMILEIVKERFKRVREA